MARIASKHHFIQLISYSVEHLYSFGFVTVVLVLDEDGK